MLGMLCPANLAKQHLAAGAAGTAATLNLLLSPGVALLRQLPGRQCQRHVLKPYKP